jgi:CheY-like chemotaxis protein
MLLKMWGHGVHFAESGPDGLKRASDMRPDIALIDIGLPGLSGYDVARHIRARSDAWARAVTLVALTGYGRDADREEALNAGFDCHLVKPIDPDVLASTLKLR